MNSDWLTAVTSPMLQREKNTFLNAGIQPRDQCVTRRKEGTFQEPQNKLSTSFMTTEILASCAGIQLYWDGVTTVGLDLLLISNDYQTPMGKDRRQTAWLLPFSGIPRKCTPPYSPPPLTRPVTTHDCLPLPPDS